MQTNSTNPPPQSSGNRRVGTEGELFGKLRDDMTISHGAFRLWHVLKGKAGPRGYCWPGQRWLSKKLHSSIHSLKPWIKQLVDRGYLRVERFDRRKHPDVSPHHNGVVYILPNAVAETGHSTVADLASALCPNQDTAAVSKTGHIIKINELSKENQSQQSEGFSFIDIEAEFKRQNSSSQEARIFFDCNEGHGWQIDGKPIKSLPAVVRGWLKRKRKTGTDGDPTSNACKAAKCVSDADCFRIFNDGKCHEFNRDSPPPEGTLLHAAWSNWRACPESYRKKT